MISKSSLLRSVTKRPFLSITVKSILTRKTSTVIRVGSALSITGVCCAAHTAAPSAPAAARVAQTRIFPDYSVAVNARRDSPSRKLPEEGELHGGPESVSPGFQSPPREHLARLENRFTLQSP